MSSPASNDAEPAAFTPDELQTLYAIFDAFMPAIPVSELLERAPRAAELDPETLAAFAAQAPSAIPRVRAELLEFLPRVVPRHKLAELKQVVGILRSTIGTLAFTGGLTPFHQLSVRDREQLLLSWKMSRLATFRKVYDALVGTSVILYLRNSALAHRAMQYELVPAVPPPEGHYKFKFISPLDIDDSTAFDAIIVGSGSGGGVAAKTLSEGGMRVLVIEKGMHFAPDGDKVFSEAEAFANMYDVGGLAQCDDSGAVLLSGNVFGGGTTVNWSASLQTPYTVRQDWATTFKLPYFVSQEFQTDLDDVCKVMGVSPPTSQNIQNSTLLEGARKLGYQHAAVPQNNGGGEHKCGHECANSCRSGGKKGGVHSWLVDASKAGAQMMVGHKVKRIVFDDNRQAEGIVIDLDNGEEKTIRAPRVIVSGGSVQSPALLLRSKIPNARVGASLHIHPTNYVHAIFPHRTHPTTGNILTSVVGEFANLTPSGHGVRIETGNMQPAISAALLQWSGGAEAKARLTKHAYMVGCIAIARDRDHGRVRLNQDGDPLVEYTPSAFDQASIVKGTIAAAECMKVAGADEIIVAARGVRPWKRGDNWDAWTRLVHANPPGAFGSAHQMASNRMAGNRSGVCDANGAVRGVKGVWVADASVLPSASGVNPMITTMAVARMVSRGVLGGYVAGHVEANI